MFDFQGYMNRLVIKKNLTLFGQQKSFLDLLVKQFMGKCPSCSLTRQMDYSIIETCTIVRWQCPSGHKGRFSSSREVNGLWANNLQTAAAPLREQLCQGCQICRAPGPIIHLKFHFSQEAKALLYPSY